MPLFTAQARIKFDHARRLYREGVVVSTRRARPRLARASAAAGTFWDSGVAYCHSNAFTVVAPNFGTVLEYDYVSWRAWVYAYSTVDGNYYVFQWSDWSDWHLVTPNGPYAGGGALGEYRFRPYGYGLWVMGVAEASFWYEDRSDWNYVYTSFIDTSMAGSGNWCFYP